MSMGKCTIQLLGGTAGVCIEEWIAEDVNLSEWIAEDVNLSE